MRKWMLGVASLVVLLVAVPSVPAQAAVRVTVSAPQYESPGGMVPTIVTVHDVPAGYSAEISAHGTDGADVECVGGVWFNRVRRTGSRTCYLRLPNRAGSYNVVGQATLSKTGAPAITVSGSGGRAVLANGHSSPEPMPMDRVARIERCHNPGDEVWLTFDDGGSAAQVGSILDTLARNNARGRFFFTGAWGASEPGLLDRIKREGHLVANHSATHSPLSRATDEEVRRQIRGGLAATTSPRLLRPPFAAGALTTRLEALAAEEGYSLCRWTVDTFDWDGPSVDEMVDRITYGDYRSPPIEAGGNILMHGAGRNTAAGLQRIIDAVRSKQLTVEPLRRPPTAVGGAAASPTALWVGYTNGAVKTVGGSVHHGDASTLPLAAPIVGLAATPGAGGYWLLGRDGGVFAYGDARFHGSTGGIRLNQPVVSLAADSRGRGYWFVASDGGVFAFGVPFRGSAGGVSLAQPVVGMASTRSGDGYWLVASDGGVFSYGDAIFSGSTGNLRLNQPVVAMAPDPDGVGYWFVAADGGVFSFDAQFHGSGVGGDAPGDRVVGMVAHPAGGYWLITASGAVHGYGAASTAGL